jgi:hypothetical protein
MARVLAASGVAVPGEDGPERQRLAWLGAEMGRFLWFCRDLPVDTPVGRALEAYGRSLKEGEGKYPDWRLDQARDALKLFRNGIEDWRIEEGERGREVRFRVREVRGGDEAEGGAAAAG